MSEPRPSPFELGLPDGEFAAERFEQITHEAHERGVGDDDPESFLLLGQVGRTVQDLRGGEGGEEALRSFGAFIFQAYHFDRAGRPLFRLEKTAARYLVESNPAPEGWDRSLPEPAGYLQLPIHLFWTRPVEDGPAEPVDGLFWSRTAGEGLALLLIAGIRDDRAGFSVVPTPSVPLRDAEEWIARDAREDGEDFETTLPGGELDRLYSIETTGELLKLAARTFAYVATVPEAVVRSDGARRVVLTG